jgi:DNA polymerase bacteriophage-type
MQTPNRIWLDSETYSDTDISRGVANYTDNCEPIILTYAFDNEPVQVWQEHEPLPVDLINAIAAGVPVYAHNALFDFLALRRTLPLTLEQMRDTMAIASSNHLPASLDKFTQILGTEVGKQANGKALIRFFCCPNKAGARNMPQDHPEKWAEFISYAVDDVASMREATLLCRELSDYEQNTWLMTQRMNLRGVPVNLKNAQHFKELAMDVKKALNEELYALTGIASASQAAALAKWITAQGFEITGLAKDVVRELLTKELPANIRRVLEIRQQASMTSPKKFDVLIDTAHEGRIKGAYMYHGANTGRYASRGGLNLQNIPRGSEKDAVRAYHIIADCDLDAYEMSYGLKIEPLSSIIRPTLEASKGKKFVDYDYSSIENRVAPWIGYEDSHLELFRNGLDEYKDMATEINKVAYEDVTKDMRQMAKPAVLGAVFGAGAKGLQSYYAQYGIEITIERAQELVDIYRTKHEGIKNAWYAFGSAILAAVKTPRRKIETNRCTIASDGRFLRLRLPSGRVISWFAPKVEVVTAPWGKQIPAVTVMQKHREKPIFVRQQLIGSSVFQSVVQATARDILVHAMHNLEAAGYDLVLTTHDEVVAEVDEQWDSLPEFEQLMTDNPKWCPEIPLAVEGWVDRNYQK